MGIAGGQGLAKSIRAGIASPLLRGAVILLIVLAQAANALFLPVVLLLLLVIANRNEFMGRFRNTRLVNALGVLVVLVIAALSVLQLARISGILE